MHNFRIQTTDGESFDMAHSFNVLVGSFVPSQPDASYTTHDVSGRNGLLLTDVNYGARTIEASCSIYANSPTDLALQLRRLGALMRRHQTFYILPDSEPGLRWLVSCAGPSGVQQAGSFATFSLTFSAWQPFAESDELLTPTFATTSFIVRNQGDIAVDPRALPFELTFTGVSTNLRIRNLATGDDWRYTGATSAADTIRQTGVRSTKNSLSIVRSTNLGLISLAPGDNEFVITGASGATSCSFAFREYYL